MTAAAARSASSPARPPGRPPEIEDPTNRFLVHPLSRALVDRLERSPLTPNQVSVAGALAAILAAAAYAFLPWPLGPLVGFAWQIAWHVLDGADGDLARRTGRASPVGELVDGVCDHVAQAALYLAFGFVLARQIGPLAWTLALAAALSHFLQANAYETGRKAYRRFVYGAPWMADNEAALQRAGKAQGMLGAMYLAVSAALDRGEVAVAMRAHPGSEAAARYRAAFEREVRASAILGSNLRTLVAFAAMLAGSPLWLFVFEIVVLNLALALFLVWRARAGRALAAALRGG